MGNRIERINKKKKWREHEEYQEETKGKETSGSCDRASLTQEKKEPTDDTSIDVYSQQVNSTCFLHHYAHRQETDCIKARLVLA